MNNYIKMCEKAEKIQKLWKPVNWDRFIFKNDKSVGIGSGHIESYMKAWYIWLPTQEQLQEMSSLLCNFPCQILTFLNNWIKENEIHLSQCGSMNELWLAFVMKEKWNKIWTGKEWINE